MELPRTTLAVFVFGLFQIVCGQPLILVGDENEMQHLSF